MAGKDLGDLAANHRAGTDPAMQRRERDARLLGKFRCQKSKARLCVLLHVVKWLLVNTAIANFERNATEGRVASDLTKKEIIEALDDGGSYHPVRNSFHDINFGDDFGMYAHVCWAGHIARGRRGRAC
jgi:hypothetical protein